MLLGLHITNFEILRDTKIGITEPEEVGQDWDAALAAGLTPAIPLSPLTTLIGRNGTGKSCLLHALSFLSDAVRYGARDAATMRGRGGFTHLRYNGCKEPMAYRLAVRLEQQRTTVFYRVAFHCDGHGRPFIQSEEAVHVPDDAADAAEKPLPLLRMENGSGTVTVDGHEEAAGVGREDMTALQAYGSIVRYAVVHALNAQMTRWFFSSFPAAHTETLPPVEKTDGGHRHLSPSGNNIANVLRYMNKHHPNDWEAVLSRIRKKMPGRRAIDQAVLDNRASISSRRLFSYLLLLEDPNPRPMVCMEHPDEGLHHEMVELLAGELRKYVLRSSDEQVILTTHNPNIIETLAPDEVWVFERDDDPDHADAGTTVRCAGADPVVRSMYEEGIGMGSMWYSGHFDPEGDHAS